MVNFLKFLTSQKRLLQQQHEIKQLRKQIDILTQQNDSMRQGMRRCITCEYRNTKANTQRPYATETVDG